MLAPDLSLPLVPRAAAAAPLALDFVAGQYSREGVQAASFTDLTGIAFTRTGAGTAQTSSGAITAFATAVPRITDRGLLLEAAATNLILNSVFAGGGTPTSWSALGAPSPSASGLSSSVAAITCSTSASRVWIVQGRSVTAGAAYAVSVQVESVTGSIQANQVIGSGLSAGIAWPSCPANPAGGASGQVQTGRLTAIFTPVGATEQFRLGAGVNSNVTATVVLSLPQVVSGAEVTSPILTTGAAATRGADVASIVVPVGATAWEAVYGETGAVVGGAVTPGTTFDLTTGRPWFSGFLKRFTLR